MKKFNYFILGVLSLFMATAANAQLTVLGYFPSYRATSVIEYDKLTDVVFAFINPNTNGTLNLNNTDATFGFDNNKFVVVKAGAQSNGVKLWIAVGGADAGEQRSARLQSICANATYRANLVSDLVSFAITHGLEGIDLDWEFPKNATARLGHYNLVKDLRAAINASSKPSLKISIAVGAEYKFSVNHLQYLDSRVISETDLVDKVNVMAYDFPTTYNVNHSSYTDAENCMKEWNAVMGVPYSKMLLGIPFYGRNSWGEIEYNNLTGNAATNYTSDQANGYYYNGKTTLEAKMDLVSAKGAKGILIWDLGQDRTDQYSLLAVLDAKAKTFCSIPSPNLGADRGVCAGQSTTLDPGVVAASGRTFAWTKDGASTGGNTTTLDVSAAGTYKVTISDASCSREDEIEIVTGSSVTTTGASGCNNVPLTLTVSNPAAGKTYKWFDAASSGTELATGNSYTSTFATTTTVYVEEAAAGVNSYTSSPATIPSGKFHAWAGGQYTKLAAQMLVVEKDLTVKSLRVMASALNGLNFSVKVIDANNKTAVAQAGPFNSPGDGTSQAFVANYFDFDANIALTPGTYLVYLSPTGANDSTNYGLINGHTEETAEAGVFTIKGSTFQSGSDESGFNIADEGQAWWTAHGPFLNWVIETGANASCGRTAATATVQVCGPPTIVVNNPTAAEVFTYSDPATDVAVPLSATVSDEGTITTLVFEVYKGGALVETVVTTNNGGTYTGTFTSGVQGSDYTFKVSATDNDNNTSTKEVAFEIQKTVGVVELADADVQLFPNPSSTNFQITVGSVSSFTLNVYTVSGQLVETVTANSNTVTFGADLAAGSYVVEAVSTEGTYQTQVVKK